VAQTRRHGPYSSAHSILGRCGGKSGAKYFTSALAASGDRVLRGGDNMDHPIETFAILDGTWPVALNDAAPKQNPVCWKFH
jgi:hypothetical protein